jgi:hypothetical protein
MEINRCLEVFGKISLRGSLDSFIEEVDNDSSSISTEVLVFDGAEI